MRRVIGPLLVVVLTAAVLLLPVLVIVAAFVSAWLPGRWRGLRLLAFALAYLALEVAGLLAAAVLWVLSGFGRRLHAPGFQGAHYTVLRVLLDLMMRLARRLFALRLVTDGTSWSPLDDGVPGSTNAMVVLSRHAGPGDSFLLVHTLMDRDHLRRPRIVLKDALQLDPLIDVYLNRLPNQFLSAGPAVRSASAEAIADLARDLGEEDALLLFPEGANFTARRRTRAIERLRERGLLSAVHRAEAMQRLLPPRPAGVAAAVGAAPHADVVFVAHTGLEHMRTVRDLWRSLPMEKTLHLRWWFVPAAEVPRDRAQQTEWLYQWWETIDAWIATARNPAGRTTRVGGRPPLTRPGLPGRGADVRAFSLLADEAEELHGTGAGGAEPVRGAGVELGGVAGFEDQVVLAEDESEPAVEDEGPVVTFVGPQVGLSVVASDGEDELVGLDASGSAAEGQDGPAVVGEDRAQVDARVSGRRGVDELVEGGAVRACQR